MDALRQDLRFALRTTVRTPVFTLAATVAIALGIGANTAIFSLADTLILRPQPFPDADRLVVLWEENASQGARYNELAPASLRAVAERARALQDVVAYDLDGATLTGVVEPERLNGLVVEWKLFGLLGVSPALGRSFTPDDDRAGAEPVALISHGLWERRFGGDRGAVGSTILLDGRPTTVIGVMPRGFTFGMASDFWRPLALPAAEWDGSGRWLRAVARLSSTASFDDARAELQTIATQLESERPATSAGWRFSLHSLNEGLAQGPMRPLMIALLAAVGFVLLIACADVANLLLARASGREREIALRAALGASRARIMRQLLTESLLLAVIGAAAGVLLASWSLDLLRAALPADVLRFEPRLAALAVDERVLGFTALLTLSTALLFGLVPAWRASRPNITSRLKQGDRATAGDPARNRLRGALVTLQVALALVLFSAGTLMMRSFLAQQAAHPAFRSQDLLTLWVSPRAAAYPDAERVLTFHRTVLERVSRLPAVTGLALTNAFPLSGENYRPRIDIPGRPRGAAEERPAVSTRMVTHSYLELLGVPLRAGRALEERDRRETVPVAVVSESFARQFFPAEDPLGRHIALEDGEPRQIVGVVADVQDWRLGTSSMAMLYLPLEQMPPRTVALVARTRGAHAAAADAIRSEIYALDNSQPVYNVRTMNQVLRDALFSQRLGSALMSIFAVVALLLAAVGVYGVMAFVVSQRTQEIGVRIALGAHAGHVARHLLRIAILPVVAGVVFGLAGAVLTARVLARVLWGAAPLQATTPLFAALTLTCAALLAVALPAWRATRVDPVLALRGE